MKNKRPIIFMIMTVLFCACSKNESITTMNPLHQTTKAPVITDAVQKTPTKTMQPTVMPDEALRPTSTPAPTSTSTPASTPIPVPVSTSVPVPTPVSEPAIRNDNPSEGCYWLQQYENNTGLQLSLREIAAINEQNFRASGTSLEKLSDTEEINPKTVLRMIESYSFPEKKYYNNVVLTDVVKNELCKCRNLEALQTSEEIVPAFGILIKNSDLRSFPAEYPLTASKNGRYDYLQETVLLLNEAVIVLHTSTDGQWCFVQAENYFGWIREAAIAYCEKEEMLQVYKTVSDTQSLDFFVVTKNTIWKKNEETVELRMGTKLLAGAEGDEKNLWLPVRNGEKKYELKSYCINPEDELYSGLYRGYLPYTEYNAVKLAVSLLETPYAWGDALPYPECFSYNSEIGMDCSSTVGAVYRCFGFVMPRNTSAQQNMDWAGDVIDTFTIEKKKELFDGLKAGTLLYTPGHVMFYLGKHEDEYYILHNTTTERMPDGTEAEFYRCVITSMNLGEKGNTIWERMSAIKSPN